MENNEEKSEKKMIGGRVPVGFAEKFTNYCKDEGMNQSVLFHNLTKWWMNLDEPIQWLIYRGKVSEAHSQIAEEVASAQAAADDESAAASDSAKRKRKPGRRSSSRTG